MLLLERESPTDQELCTFLARSTFRMLGAASGTSAELRSKGMVRAVASEGRRSDEAKRRQSIRFGEMVVECGKKLFGKLLGNAVNQSRADLREFAADRCLG